jgi:hypothetical protein
MKFFAILLLAGAALAQSATPPTDSVPQNPAPSVQLPIKTGEWKMTAIVHGKENDLTHTFFTCMTQSDLTKLVPQQGNLPKNLSCTRESQQFSAHGMTMSVTCKSPGATVHTNYDLTRSTDTLVTGTMKMAVETTAGGAPQESSTSIVFEWQNDECVKPDAAKPDAAKPPVAAPPATEAK